MATPGYLNTGLIRAIETARQSMDRLVKPGVQKDIDLATRINRDALRLGIDRYFANNPLRRADLEMLAAIRADLARLVETRALVDGLSESTDEAIVTHAVEKATELANEPSSRFSKLSQESLVAIIVCVIAMLVNVAVPVAQNLLTDDPLTAEDAQRIVDHAIEQLQAAPTSLNDEGPAEAEPCETR
ncbi:MAG TPA: hypothetical protein VNS09_03760 [Solirubrobacter sp.]|nr:hypothetical protein [Solirubrobacter sp.]